MLIERMGGELVVEMKGDGFVNIKLSEEVAEILMEKLTEIQLDAIASMDLTENPELEGIKTLVMALSGKEA